MAKDVKAGNPVDKVEVKAVRDRLKKGYDTLKMKNPPEGTPTHDLMQALGSASLIMGQYVGSTGSPPEGK